MPSDPESTPIERVHFLARAPSRVDIVRHLLTSGPATQRELRSHLDASRTTVARSLRSLERKNWVEFDDGAYRLTHVGTTIADAFTDLVETIRTTDEFATFLRWFPSDHDAPDFVDVSDATVTTSGDGDPYAPARKQTEILDSADELRFLLPSIDLDSTGFLREQVTDGALEAETVVSSDLEPTLESSQFAPHIRAMVRTGRSTIFVASTDLPFYLGLAGDGRTQIGVEDDHGFPRALLETSDPTVREWAESVYREYRERARHKPAEDL